MASKLQLFSCQNGRVQLQSSQSEGLLRRKRKFSLKPFYKRGGDKERMQYEEEGLSSLTSLDNRDGHSTHEIEKRDGGHDDCSAKIIVKILSY